MKQKGRWVPLALGLMLAVGVLMIFAGYRSGRDTSDIKSDEEVCRATISELLGGIPGVGRAEIFLTTRGEGKSFTLLGVAVICEGGGDEGVCREIKGAISALYGTSSDRIFVSGMK